MTSHLVPALKLVYCCTLCVNATLLQVVYVLRITSVKYEWNSCTATVCSPDRCEGHSCKNRRPYNLYCVGADIRPCPINQSVSQSVSQSINQSINQSCEGHSFFWLPFHSLLSQVWTVKEDFTKCSYPSPALNSAVDF